ncbi:hypothetical protein ACHFJ0_04930 [Paracoccus sp. NGMCC 1.201697]|uniref:Uncharacterized protein n=1 Tax=Paracoccus broussonetiae subsp. drimophilus TaxID=3373869 RepID=A0ABW7LGV8_9RHOB
MIWLFDNRRWLTLESAILASGVTMQTARQHLDTHGHFARLGIVPVRGKV